MTDSIVLLGSTGSIGAQTLSVCRALGTRVLALAAGRNIDLLERQARELGPETVAMYDEAAASELKARLRDLNIRVLGGAAGVADVARIPCGRLVNAVGGMAGVELTIEAAKSGVKIALANKESLVAAGERVMALARESGAELIPIDSEHSAIFQCLQGAGDNKIKRLILTASGGPFYGKTREEMRNVTPEEARRHPNWNMGAKISVDCATMMNKGLELIEAMRLFSLPPERITVLVHRQSVVHSAVEFEDGAVIAQLGAPDMRLPIQYALTYPRRLPCHAPPLDLTKTGALTFETPDTDAFPCLALAYEAAKSGEDACRALCEADEKAVSDFLAGKIGFSDIYEYIRTEMNRLTRERLTRGD
ncbi:MAG: 1-deoxy-D-xylulose-5-phosphate reductoisomerase [Oscillospiraceae bacterium]|jgi:1-deoxy-D-xylulose-5-phosphate reductoisomerase|nr:1-deoxy-D-xylulose-5-phosphate reductoisomerase [Oscillospiraceae bacterium]